MPSANDPDVLAQLALRDFEQGRITAAEQKCMQALTGNRQHALALSVLGMILHSQARHEDAARVFNALTIYRPGEAEHWENLGVALRSLERYDDALAVLDRALQLGSRTPSVLYNLALVHIDRCEHGVAYGLLSEASERAPRDAAIRCAFAQCCYDLVRSGEASEALRDWRSLDGLTPDLIAQIAFLLFLIGEAPRAEQALDEARRAPQNTRSSLLLIRALERTNRLAEAEELMQRLKQAPRPGAEADPDFALAEAVLAQRRGEHDAASRLLSRGLEEQRDTARRHQLLFPLAKSLDALGRYDEAYAALEAAHRSQSVYLRRIIGRTDVEPAPGEMLTETPCDPSDVETWSDRGGPPVEGSPIFIVAFPRSGTTLLEQMLDAHPLLQSMDEQPFLNKAIEDIAATGVSYPRELGRLTEAQLEAVRTAYWERARKRVALRPGQRLVDKNPLNMIRLPLIRRLFPRSRIILAVRHPFDTLLSCYMQQFRAPDLALFCTDLATLARHYVRVFDFWYSQWPLLRPVSRELRYESLVAGVEPEMRQLAEFLELPWDDAMLAPGAHAQAKPYISTPSYSQVIRPVHQGSIGRWKYYARRFDPVRPTLAAYLERWGYEA